MDFIRNYIRSSIALKSLVLNDSELILKIDKAASEIVKSFKNGGKLLIAGNGGSAADAQHIAAEFVNKFYKVRKPLPAMALTVDTSVITSIANDFGYELIFEKQLEAIARENDIFIGISTSGYSKNLINAFKKASKMKIKSIALLGQNKGEIDKVADIVLNIPSSDTPKVQESQMMIGHIISGIVENSFFGEK